MLVNAEEKEVNEFIKKSPIIPCFIIAGDDGKIETVFDGFERKDIPIQKIKENSTKIISQEATLFSNIVIDQKYNYNILFGFFNLNYDERKNRNDKKFKQTKFCLIQHKLYSFSIREEDLNFSKYYTEQLEKIANSELSTEKKVQELEKIFSKIGYFIPKKIYIGGMIISRSNKLKKNENSNNKKNVKIKRVAEVTITEEESNLGSTNIDIKSIFENEKTEKIGGNKSAKNYEEWYKSINLSNSNVIECSNIITAGDIIKNDLKEKLREPLQIIEDKYSRKRKYIEKLENIYKIKDLEDENEDNKLMGKKDYCDFHSGICKESKESSEPYIYREKFIIDTHVSWIPPVYNEEFHKTFKDIIVGFEIISDRKDGYNGQWTIKNEPIGNNEIIINFASCVMRGQDFTIYVYLMKKPE